MATIDSLVADLQNYTEAGTSVLPSAQALECVNLALRRMQRRHDWRPMQRSVDLTITGGAVNSVPLPTDFLREVFVYTVDPGQRNPAEALVPIARLLKPQWFASSDPLANRDPIFPNVAAPSTTTVVRDLRNYYLWADRLVIVPTPSGAITIRLDYSARLPELVIAQTPAQQNELTVLHADVVRAAALAEAYDWLHEETRAQRWMLVFEQRFKEAVDADNAIAFAGPPARRGT